MSLAKLQRQLVRQRIHNRNVELAQNIAADEIRSAVQTHREIWERTGFTRGQEALTRYVMPKREAITPLGDPPEMPRVRVPVYQDTPALLSKYEHQDLDGVRFVDFEVRPVQVQLSKATVVRWWEWMPVRYATRQQLVVERVQGIADKMRAAIGKTLGHDPMLEHQVKHLADRLEELLPELRAGTGIVREERKEA